MYVITGATGHTGVSLQDIVGPGQKVRAIGRSADRLEALAAEGAEPFVCDITDAATLTKAFSGAKAVYAMVPPSMTSQNYRADQDSASNAIAEAVEKARVEYVVSLSSVGADKAQGTGPVVGLHYLEQKLNRIPSLNALHLRPGYFMENTLAQVALFKRWELLRPSTGRPGAANDCDQRYRSCCCKALLDLDFTDKQTRELLGQRDVSYDDAATIIGKAIGKPDLKYVQLPDEQVRGAFLQMGISENVADLILEMSAALNSGYMEPLEERTAENTTPTSFETFVTDEFLPLYRGKATTA
jgi:uncharacterized protein YbjT (DUF2867 family)